MSFASHCLLLAVCVLCAAAALLPATAAMRAKPLPKYKRSFINPYPRFQFYKDNGDPGLPLFLTPFIHNESIPRADVREMAKVQGTQFLGVESYAGYLTVDARFNSSMFFWYFPSVENAQLAPVVLWLQGGPGASSLFGLFAENGPFAINKHGHLEKRKYTWSQTQHLIYIDNPVGTGFSFTDHDEGYAKNEKDVARNLHEAVQQLYELFEWSDSKGFWVTGESYAGKYVPALAYHIKHMQNSAVPMRVTIPLKGVAIGNGLTDPLHQLKYGDYLYQLGLIDEHGLQQFHVAEDEGVKLIKQHDLNGAFHVFDRLINGDMSNGSLFHNLTGFDFYFNYLKTKDDNSSSIMGKLLQSSEMRRAVHVGAMPFHDVDTQNKVEEHLQNDIMDSVAPWVADLLNTHTVCIYNGQLDIIVAYPLTRNYLQHLKFAGDEIYKSATRDIWRVDDEIAGYTKHAKHLVEIMVRDAGHMAPADQPKWMANLIHHLTYYRHVK